MLAIVMLLWAGNSIVGRSMGGLVPPFTLALLRWTGAFAVVLPFAWNSLRRDRAAIVAGWRPLVVLGVLGVGLFNALLYAGLSRTPASTVLLIQAAIPPIVLLLDRLVFAVRARGRQVAGTLLSTAGVAFVVTQGDPGRIATLSVGPGEAIVLCAVLVWAAYTVGLRRRPPVSDASFVAVTFAVGLLTTVPLAAWEWAHGLTPTWTHASIGGVAYVALFPSLIAYVLYNRAAAMIGPPRAGQAIALMPLFGALLAAALLGERLGHEHWVGMALILGGLALAALPQRKGVQR